jgi:hypothetical protein
MRAGFRENRDAPESTFEEAGGHGMARFVIGDHVSGHLRGVNAPVVGNGVRDRGHRWWDAAHGS